MDLTAQDRVKLTLGEGEWAVYDQDAASAPWWFIDTIHASDDPSSAARIGCAQKWAGGVHRILVVSATEAHEFEVAIETKRPGK